MWIIIIYLSGVVASYYMGRLHNIKTWGRESWDWEEIVKTVVISTILSWIAFSIYFLFILPQILKNKKVPKWL